MRTVLHVRARMGSKRLQNKVAFDLAGKPVFVHIFERAKEFLPNAEFILSTSCEAQDDPLAFLAQAYGYEVFRGPAHSVPRRLRLLQYLDLANDDIFIPVLGDSPFLSFEYLPFAIRKLKETKRNLFYLDIKKHTLAWGLGMWPFGPVTTEVYLRRMQSMERYIVTEDSAAWPDYFSGTRPLICILPVRYQQHWPWGQLLLDYPVQALQIKQAYDLLYKGKPFDLQEVYDLFSQRPLLANLSHGLPKTTHAAYPEGLQGFDLEELKGCTDYEVVEWDGK